MFLIVDNLEVHHSKPVKVWVAERTDRIELVYLPEYSPEANPDAYLNRDLKTNLRQEPVARTTDQACHRLHAPVAGRPRGESFPTSSTRPSRMPIFPN
ncbi:transposase [Thauera sinica]|uniref:Transposase n=1 Tax=Thauera sinica TaxID=2665146 RepID=A0ABW1AR11_9RHOO|nr:hypothetical protein CCZ27_02615 [Thauera sp. K11]